MDTIKNNLAVFQTGNKNNQSIIFIHGFPFDHKMWDLQFDYFKKDYHCITYDIRGLGVSPAGDGQFTMEGFVDDLFDIIEAFKITKLIVCGLSMGGYIALRAIERNEEIFKAVILCDTKAEADSNKKEYGGVLNRSKKSSPIGLKGCLLAMAGRTDTTDYLDKIKIPVLVFCGEEDKLTPSAVMKPMADKITGSEFHIIPGAGHITPVENSGFFNSQMDEFLKLI